MNQSELEANACNWRQARGNACDLGHDWFWFYCLLVEKVAQDKKSVWVPYMIVHSQSSQRKLTSKQIYVTQFSMRICHAKACLFNSAFQTNILFMLCLRDRTISRRLHI